MNSKDIMEKNIEEYNYFLIVDLEATCCDKKSIPRREMETIEIGAVIVEAENLVIVDELSIFIKPVRNPVLTKFCTELTSITQNDVESAGSFPEAINDFKQWLYAYENFIFCSWGDYDKSQIIQDCEYHKISYPIGSEHINIKKLFSTSQGLKKKYGMAGALKAADLGLAGTHHRGIDDAKNMARLMPYILGRKLIKS